MRKPLLRRAKANNKALMEQFTNTGTYALAAVITGRLALDTATETLLQLRNMWLDEGGDLAPLNNIKQYLKRHKMLKNTDFSWYEPSNHSS